jgi:hypothetical protein
MRGGHKINPISHATRAQSGRSRPLWWQSSASLSRDSRQPCSTLQKPPALGERSFDHVTRAILSRTAPFLALAGATAVIAIGSAPNALADLGDRVEVCSSEVVSGVEVDDCVPNPNARITSDVPGVEVKLEGGVGIGLG